MRIAEERRSRTWKRVGAAPAIALVCMGAIGGVAWDRQLRMVPVDQARDVALLRDDRCVGAIVVILRDARESVRTLKTLADGHDKIAVHARNALSTLTDETK